MHVVVEACVARVTILGTVGRLLVSVDRAELLAAGANAFISFGLK